MGTYRDPNERFWEKVDRAGPAPDYAPHLGQCWLWLAGSKKSNGGRYGNFRMPRSRDSISAHRWAWERANYPVPTGYTLDHLCRVTLCVNPTHLELVTPRVNILRGTNTAAVSARQTHCIHGHPLSGDNLLMGATKGQRMCRECRRRWHREAKARARASRPNLGNATKTVCKHGHPFDEANTYIAPNGRRSCRACGRVRALAAYYASDKHRHRA